jgi:hypothetical protein
MSARHRFAALILLSSTASVSTASASPEEHPPPGDDHVKPALLKLRNELRGMTRDTAVKVLPRFRALCDADGYPLVGNIATKGESDRMQPSEVCRLVREPPKAT